jgi:hypothetical protein
MQLAHDWGLLSNAGWFVRTDELNAAVHPKEDNLVLCRDGYSL